MLARSVRSHLLILLAFISLSLLCGACDFPKDTADGEVTDTIEDTGDLDADMGEMPKGDYFFVRITPGDSTPASEATSEDPGADIDVVILNDRVDPGSGSPRGLVNPVGVELVSDMTQYLNYKDRTVASAGNSLDAFGESDPTRITANSICDTSSDRFVSIGLAGDEGVIFTFATPIDEGDDLYIIEVGGCVREDGDGTPGVEPYGVEVSISTATDANWVIIGEGLGDGPLTTVSVPALPVVFLAD